MEEETLSPDDKEELQRLLGSPYPEEKHTVHTFLHKIASSKDTTKTAFLGDEELGTARNPVRAYKNVALFAKMVMHNDKLSEYFNSESEIVTASSLSREGFLVKMGITTTRQIADITKLKAEKKGVLANLFGKKKESQGGAE